MRIEIQQSHERDTITPQEADAIAAWLAENTPTTCPPRTYALDANDQISWKDQTKQEFTRREKIRANVRRMNADRVDRAQRRRDELAKVCHLGLSNRELAARFGVSAWVIKKDLTLLRKAGVYVKPREHQTTAYKILDLCRQKTVAEISAIVGVSENHVRSVLSKKAECALPARSAK